MPATKKVCETLENVLAVNRPLQIIFKTDTNKFIYKSSVADFDDGHIMITPITRGGKPAILRNGEKVNVIYFAHDAMYEFNTTVTGHKKENKVTLTVIEKPRRCDRVQRREFFRYPLSLKATFKRVDIEDAQGMRKFTPYGKAIDCVFDDLSGGGLSFHTSEELVDESYVLYEFMLPTESGEAKLCKEIIRIIRTKKINPLDRKGDFEYTYGSQFITLSEEKQLDIIRFIMWRQIEERKALNEKKR
jgi:c-di-GMP-binding flagellar brake protein YcgR